MSKVKVYDLPTRFFHWLFAGLFIVAFLITKTQDDDGILFNFHKLAGIAMGFLILQRVIWGFVGTKYARFNSFILNPMSLIQYFKGSVFSNTKRYLSHNPASSYAAIIMFLITIGLIYTGIQMSSGNENEFIAELHEILANLFLFTVLAHIFGILLHTFKHKDNIWLSMINGKKDKVEGELGIITIKPFIGLVFVFLNLFWFAYLNSNYNRNDQTLDLFGNTLQFGESENENNQENNQNYENEEEEDDD